VTNNGQTISEVSVLYFSTVSVASFGAQLGHHFRSHRDTGADSRPHPMQTKGIGFPHFSSFDARSSAPSSSSFAMSAARARARRALAISYSF
jgi:hypothetical protein